MPIDDSDARMLARVKSAAAARAESTPTQAAVSNNQYVDAFQRKTNNSAPIEKEFVRDPNYRFSDRDNYDAQYGKGAFDGKLPVPESAKVGGNLKVQPVPQTPTVATVAPAVSKTVKTAPIDTVLFNDDSVPIEVMADLIFENIGGHELINIARNDIVNGQKVSYQPIKNLSSIQQQYNHNNILGIQNTSDKYFSNFSIKLENKIPGVGGGPNGSNVYLDTATGNLVIETINMDNDEQVEIEITLGGIIYEAEFGEINS